MFDLIIAAIAGFVSFISPCVLPLVPAYIGYMGGRMTYTVSTQMSVRSDGTAVIQSPTLGMRFSTFLHGVAFVSGFTFVFVSLGILGSAFLSQIGSTSTIEGIIGRVGGMMIIFFGLHFMGVLPKMFNWLRKHNEILSNPLISIVIAVLLYVLLAWGFTNTVQLWNTDTYAAWAGTIALVIFAFLVLGMVVGGAFVRPSDFWNKMLNTIEYALYSDTRRQMAVSSNQGLPGSALLGVVFAAGWTPCIGPTLGTAFTLAANGGDLTRAAGLMTAYSLGLGIPFLLTALMLDSAQGILTSLKRHMNTLKLVSGAFLVFIGYLIATSQLQDWSRQFSVQFGDFSYRVEQCTVGAFEGEINWGQFGSCMDKNISFEDLREENNNQASLPGVSENTIVNVESSPSAATAEATVSFAGNGLAVQTIADAAAAAEPAIGLAVGNRAPNFEATTTTGEIVNLNELRGEVVLLNFWFTTCAPCRVEMPEFQRAYEDHNEDGLVVLAVNREEDAGAIAAFAEPLALSFPLVLDESSDIQRLYDVRGYPTTYVIDRDGIILYKSFSALTEEQIQTLVDDALS